LRENAFDAGELAIATYLQARAYGKPFIMLPAPMSGRLQHASIGFNLEHGALQPKDIEGRTVGVRSYSQTTGVWIRGILQHEYGVDLDRVNWLTVDESHLLEYDDPPNCKRISKGKKIDQMMLDGEIAAAILGSNFPQDPGVRTLIPNAPEAAEEWSRREGVIPINHVFVVQEEISRKRPDVVRELARLIRASRALAPPAVAAAMPPLGMEASRKGLEMAIDWCFEQKIIPRRLRMEELFDDTTAELMF
jgi:4,5-dihydroxyphthalate decarboxylase